MIDYKPSRLYRLLQCTGFETNPLLYGLGTGLLMVLLLLIIEPPLFWALRRLLAPIGGALSWWFQLWGWS
jgi:hypothetical protein